MTAQVVARTNLEAVKAKATYFVEVGLWPAPPRLDPLGWLKNFSTEQDIIHAVHLLNAVMYFNDDLITTLLDAAVQGIGARLAAKTDWARVQSSWPQIVDSFTFAILPSRSDAFTKRTEILTRAASTIAQGTAAQILPIEEALATIATLPDESHLVLFDDFLDDISDQESAAKVLSAAAIAAPGRVFYCPALVCQDSAQSLERYTSNLVVSTAHVLSRKYSATAEDSVVWPDRLRATAYEFLQKASHMAGISSDWVSSSRSALALGFSYRVPATTIPLLVATPAEHWRPLFSSSTA